MKKANLGDEKIGHYKHQGPQQDSQREENVQERGRTNDQGGN